MLKHSKRVACMAAPMMMIPGLAFADTYGGWRSGWGMMGNGMGFGHGLFGILWMIVFWGGLIALIVFAVRYFARSSDRTGSAKSDDRAIDLLRERFARGEIDRDEFDDRMSRLS